MAAQETTLKDIKVWKSPTQKESRIYVHTMDGREGCYYSTGNPWHAAKTWEGELTEQELAWAREISISDGKWHTVYETGSPLTVFVPEAEADVEVVEDTQAQPEPETQQFNADKHYNAGDVFERGSEKYIVIDCWYIKHHEIWPFQVSVRRPTKSEMAEINRPVQPATKEERDAFWNEFFERTAYIGS